MFWWHTFTDAEWEAIVFIINRPKIKFIQQWLANQEIIRLKRNTDNNIVDQEASILILFTRYFLHLSMLPLARTYLLPTLDNLYQIYILFQQESKKSSEISKSEAPESSNQKFVFHRQLQALVYAYPWRQATELYQRVGYLLYPLQIKGSSLLPHQTALIRTSTFYSYFIVQKRTWIT